MTSKRSLWSGYSEAGYPANCDPDYDYDFSHFPHDIEIMPVQPCHRCGAKATMVCRGWGPLAWSVAITTNDVVWAWFCGRCWEEYQMERIL